MEATERYSEGLALFLFQHDIKLGVVNPTCIKSFARSEGVRVKTDKVDAWIIAHFCKAHTPSIWVPPSIETQQLQDLYRCRQSLIDDQTQVSNRQEHLDKEYISFKMWEKMLVFIKEQIKQIDSQIKVLLETNKKIGENIGLLKSIPGIGAKISVAILAELPDISAFSTAKEIAAFVGLTPTIRQSGRSVHGSGRLSKIRNAHLRKSLFFPAIVAKQYNPTIIEFCNRLIKNGKKTMVVIVAIMRKLLHIIFGDLKHQKPFKGS